MHYTGRSLHFSILLLLLCKGFASSPFEVELLSCGTCDRASCEQPVDCPGGTVRDSCGCCEVCAKAVGEQCIPGECDESAGVLCIPDDPPHAATQIGTCQEFSPCLTFGCEAEDGQCHCSYSNKCPLVVFSYSTLVECQNSLQQFACENTNCSSEDCPEGMVYDPGFMMPGDCCPVGGSCVCDFSQCGEPTCPNNTLQAVLVTAANETDGQCCDMFECRTIEVPSCDYDGLQVPHGASIDLGRCTTCECHYGILNCLQETCPLLNCQSGSSFIPEGRCCPVCFPMSIINPTPVPSELPPPPIFSNCISSSGAVYVDGERWRVDGCTRCQCRQGQVICSSVQCEALFCKNPVSIPDVCCPVCLDEVSPSSTSTVIDMTTTHVPLPSHPPPLPPVVIEPEVPPKLVKIVLILNVPFDEYLVDEAYLVANLKELVKGAGLEVSDVKASAYGKSQTYVVTDILIEGDAFTSEAVVAVMVSDNILGMPMVHRVGTTTDIPASVVKSESEKPEGSESEDSSGGRSNSVPMIVAVVVTVSLVAMISVVGSILVAVFIVRARRKPGKVSKDSNTAKTDA